MSPIIPPAQKSLVLHENSTSYVVAEMPVPHPAATEVLVKIMACALNRTEYAVIGSARTNFFIKSWPYVPGHNAAGVVVQVGADVTNLKEGDKILFQGNYQDSRRHATCQQYATVPADLTAIIPDNVTFDQAAKIPLALIADVLILYNQSPAPENLGLRLKPVWEPEGATAYAGTPAFIVGHNPIITTASPDNEALLTSLGATHVIDRSRSNDSILAELPTLTGGKPIEYAFVGIHVVDAACRLGRDALAPGGALAIVARDPSRVPEDVANPGDGKRVGYVFGSARLPENTECCVELFKHLTEWLEKGLLKPAPVEILPDGLAGIPEGLMRLKAKQVSGGKRLVARPQETV
ncbi:GroES-like protein [Trametes punicea]|nr:GroES-like protein [Trametes punicea]